ncbi:MAG: FtsQ-type POTRA domain-containing protein [Oscillospiraceae bacterium]|nr:FtsQ-type POTRA domain-containing protein [Oscillospiraceae bacterium]
MDTTQKNRGAELPMSAQQQNGAQRSAQEQNRMAGRPEQPRNEAKKKPAAEGQRAPERKKAPKAEPVKKQEKPAKTGEKPKKKAASDAKKPKLSLFGKKPGQKKTGAASAKKAAAPAAKKAAPERPQEKKAQQTQQPVRRKPQPQEEPSYTKGLPDSVSTKKRAYGNSKPKKKTAVDLINDAVKRSGEKKAEKIKARQAEREKGVRTAPRTQQPAPAVIYTEPQSFNRRRFLMQMVTVLAVVVALVMGLSVFFKVETITVTGAEVYSPWAVRDASGIEEGDNLLTFSHARAGAQIKANLPYVKNVHFGIKLPDTVNIIIEEEDVVYAIKTPDGTWWLMTSDGRMVQQTNSSIAANYTQILGVTVTDPVVNERAVATESAAVYETNPEGETVPVPVSVTGAQRLGTALQIVKALEENDIVGEAASVDVTRLEDIVLWYGARFQVNLGNSTNLTYKIACMNDVILQMSEYQTGILDISFTIWPNQVGYTPFS